MNKIFSITFRVPDGDVFEFPVVMARTLREARRKAVRWAQNYMSFDPERVVFCITDGWGG